MNLTIELKPSKVCGIGVFAVYGFKVGNRIGKYIKNSDFFNVVPYSKIPRGNVKLERKIEDFCVLLRDSFIDHNFDELTVLDYINHSCNPNTFINREGELLAKYNIGAGIELTVDYGTVNSNPAWTMKCKCECYNCRRIITGRDFWNMPVKVLAPYLRKLRNSR